ncbi:MAG: molybdate ABC transporter permease subunit [Caldilineaceae bacterium]|nr:molybdate ABC transporter permease subunit [Caldilineaceae bacterium]MBP8110319.1 molybdate ABC transporter permease subunit [Caldilineaceae bacterium]MBP8122457.1 molybdate ABC transporter permease subunit [Caldilineaceae bacterium]MBP9074644.1 molybdate ABC transporter permease subunit [Caldilineaceae bacterium]
MASRSPSPIRPRPEPSRRVSPWHLLSLPMLIFLALPLAALIYRAAPGEIWRNLAMPQVRQAITLSLSTTLISTALIVILGTPLAYLLAKGRIPLRQVVDSLVDLPAVLPPAVAGVALLITFGRRGVLGGFLADWDIYIAFTSVAVIMAQVFVASPFFIKAATAGFAAIDPELEQAAALDGADGWQIFRHVTAPLAWNGMVGGAVMAWARALGEFGATIIFAGNYPGRTQTMPLAIYIGFELDLNVALTLAVILMGAAFLVLLVVKGLLARDLGIMRGL